ncbi:hypothetical protein NDU88_001799 [Pleurodeles waltl]|uniref:Uncharacterized protein n=1 Tax=Pleurodeles waltl TaxID=8319 RepID=A0AAV7KQE3_PLEWA|nr:hypothetical protein NDU88_001799 [Pleurodeles waltl]
MEVPRPPVYYSPKHSVGERPGDKRRGLTGLLGDVDLSPDLSVGFAQAALTPQRDPRSRGESKGKPAANSKSDGSPVLTLAALHSPSPSLKLSVGFAQAALTPQRDPRSGFRRSRGESKG